MPLLCISLLAFLVLPLSLSCDTKRSQREVRDHWAVVQTHLDNTREIVTTLLETSSCPELRHKQPNCTADRADIVNTLLILTCRMQNLGLSHTEGLTTTVQQSIDCPCPEKSTKESSGRRQNTWTATRRRRTEQRKSRREIKKLCKAKAILSPMTGCYEKLNSSNA